MGVGAVGPLGGDCCCSLDDVADGGAASVGVVAVVQVYGFVVFGGGVWFGGEHGCPGVDCVFGGGVEVGLDGFAHGEDVGGGFAVALAVLGGDVGEVHAGCLSGGFGMGFGGFGCFVVVGWGRGRVFWGLEGRLVAERGRVRVIA